ncbi:MAG TPA: hypothetical protein VNM37_00995, partial [Candidatus Dormibacteraeota bacterium]|nr:hypothetical protein [Candidatus Dormibacteraeota bacterium]
MLLHQASFVADADDEVAFGHKVFGYFILRPTSLPTLHGIGCADKAVKPVIGNDFRQIALPLARGGRPMRAGSALQHVDFHRFHVNPTLFQPMNGG